MLDGQLKVVPTLTPVPSPHQRVSVLKSDLQVDRFEPVAAAVGTARLNVFNLPDLHACRQMIVDGLRLHRRDLPQLVRLHRLLKGNRVDLPWAELMWRPWQCCLGRRQQVPSSSRCFSSVTRRSRVGFVALQLDPF
jgi:hypothetical protein